MLTDFLADVAGARFLAAFFILLVPYRQNSKLMTMHHPLLRVLILWSFLLCPVSSFAQLGKLEATYPTLGVTKFVLHPTQPYIYATVWSENSVAIINTNTLALENMVPVGSGPRGLAISPDGNRLYVANAAADFISVLDTHSRTTLPSVPVSESPRDVEVGADGRLYVLGTGSLMQLDPVTGASVGPNFPVWVYSGELEISPNKDRLYYADYGLTPASLYQYDVTVSPPVKLWESPHGGTSGSSGRDLNISHDGSFISYPCGAGQLGYSIAKYRTSDMEILGSFETGAFPDEIAFSPDDAIAYTVHRDNFVEAWNTDDFSWHGSFNTTGSNYGGMSELMVDRSGKHLFAAYSDNYYENYELRVYSTGRGVPEPSGAGLALIGLIFASCRRLSYRSY